MRSSLLPIAALACAVVISACGSSGSSNGGNGSSSGGGSGGGSSGASSSGASSSGGSGGSGSSSGTVLPDAAVDGDVTPMDSGTGGLSYTVQFGPITVNPGVDNTQCIVVNLNNPTTLKIGQIHDLLGNASHHMILYKLAAGTPLQPTPQDCTPFQDTLNPSMGSPLVISQKKDDLVTLPPGVAFSLDPNQIVRLEMHYINANTFAQTLVTTSTLYPIDPATYKADAAFLFIGDINISIPANATFSTGQQYFAMPSQYDTSNFFAITGHEHHLGTNVQVWSASSSSDPGVQIYQSQSWSDPPTTKFAPPLRTTAGGGFKYQCDWDNTTNATVSFGEHATDEMCFFWAYYWPSQGVSVCFNANGGSLCCPQAGAAICSQL
jgi:hypothetical protein